MKTFEVYEETSELLEGRRSIVASWIQYNLKPVEQLMEESSLDDFDEDITAEALDFEVREYQLDAWANLWEARHAGFSSGLIHLATGLGKTSVAVFDAIKFREEHSSQHKRGPRILFASHMNEINEQASQRFSAFIPDASQSFYNGNQEILDADITFSTMQSLYSNLGSIKPDYFDYIIYDEAHHAKAETFEAVVNYFNPAFKLALTATPDRLDELDIRELFGDELYSKGLDQALAEGLLAKPDYHIVLDAAVKEAIESSFDPQSLTELRSLLDAKPRNEVIAENIKKEMQRLGLEFGKVKTIVFCHDIVHSEEMAELLGAEAYHSLLLKGKRKEIFNRFREGDLQTICVRDMFNEGIDIPNAELIIFLRSTSSATVFEQQLGRGLRKHRGKDKVTVLDFVANIERILTIKKLAESVKHKLKNIQTGESTKRADKLTEDEEDMFNPYASKTDFIFDQVSVNLLEKYYEITATPAPKGFVSLNSFAKQTHVSWDVLIKIVDDYDIEVGRHKFKQAIGKSLSPQAQVQILEVLSSRIGPPPEGYVSLPKFASEIGIHPKTLEKLMTEHKLKAEKHRMGVIVGRSLSPEIQEELREIVKLRPALPPKGYLSIKAFADVMDFHPKTLQGLIDKNKVETEIHRYGGHSGTSLSPEAQTKLRALIEARPPRTPAGYKSLNSFAKSLGIGLNKIRKLIIENEIDVEEHLYGGNAAESLSPEAQRALSKLTLN